MLPKAIQKINGTGRHALRCRLLSSAATAFSNAAPLRASDAVTPFFSFVDAGQHSRAMRHFQRMLDAGHATGRDASLVVRISDGDRGREAVAATAEAGVATGGACDALVRKLRAEAYPAEAAELALGLAARGLHGGTGRIRQRAAMAHASELQAQLRNGALPKARGLFRRLLAQGVATPVHMNILLKSLGSRACEQTLDVARRFGVMPDRISFNTLITKHMLEADVDAAADASERLIAAGFSPDAFTSAALNAPYERRRASVLQDLVRDGRFQEAVALFDALLNANVANGYHCAIALKACTSADEADLLLRRSEKAGIELGPVPYNTLVTMYMVEAEPGAARSILDDRMRTARVSPNAESQRALDPDRDYRKIRTARLASLSRAGEHGAADRLCRKLLHAGECGIIAVNVVLKGLDTDACNALLDVARAAGIMPDTASFNTLIAKLCLHGRRDDAAAMLPIMAVAGLSPDRNTKLALERTYAKQRTALLIALVRAGQQRDALALYDQLLLVGEANKFHCNTALLACAGSTSVGVDKEVEEGVKKCESEGAVAATMLKVDHLLEQSLACGVEMDVGTHNTALAVLLAQYEKHRDGDGSEGDVASLGGCTDHDDTAVVEAASRILKRLAEAGLAPDSNTVAVLEKGRNTLARTDKGAALLEAHVQKTTSAAAGHNVVTAGQTARRSRLCKMEEGYYEYMYSYDKQQQLFSTTTPSSPVSHTLARLSHRS